MDDACPAWHSDHADDAEVDDQVLGTRRPLGWESPVVADTDSLRYMSLDELALDMRSDAETTRRTAAEIADGRILVKGVKALTLFETVVK